MDKILFAIIILAVSVNLGANTEEDTVSLAFDSVAKGDSQGNIPYGDLPHYLFAVGDKKDFNYFRSAVLSSDYNIPAVMSLMRVMTEVFQGVSAAYVKDLTGQKLLSTPKGIVVSSTFAALPNNSRGGTYSYTVKSEFLKGAYYTGTKCDITIELHFPVRVPSISAIPNSDSYRLIADNIQIRTPKFEISNDDASFVVGPDMEGITIETLDVDILTEMNQSGLLGVHFKAENFNLDLNGVLTESDRPIDGSVVGTYAAFDLNIMPHRFLSTADVGITSADMATHFLAEGVYRKHVEDYDDSMKAITVIEEGEVGGALSVHQLLFIIMGVLLLFTVKVRIKLRQQEFDLS